jgi:polar amino acid transport system substrate-binding protein
MATNAYFQPYEYHEGDAIVGIDPEIAKAVADKLGLELVIEDVEFDSIIAGVQAGKYDIGCAGMTVTEDRLKSVNFSTPYATGVQSVIVVEGSEITDVDKLLAGNYKVGVQTGTTGDIYMSSSVEDGGVGEDRVERFAKGNDAVIALQSGKIDAVVIDNEPAKAFVAAANK